MGQDIQKIDYIMIQKLREKGFHTEAYNLINAHQNAIKKNIEIGKKINAKIEKKILYTKRRRNNLCVLCGKKLSENSRNYCDYCFNYRKNRRKKR